MTPLSLLPTDEIQRLTVEYARTHSPTIEDALVRGHLRLVATFARAASRTPGDYEDLFQEGSLGLVEGIRHYDPMRGVKLSTYAGYWIRARIYHHLIVNQRLVRLGTTQAQRRLFFGLSKLRRELDHDGIEATPAEIARRLGLDEREVAETSARLDRSDVSIDAPRAGDRALSDQIAAEGDPERASARAEEQLLVRQRVHAYRRRLAPRDRAIFDARWMQDKPATLDALGALFGVSRERVRQIERRVLDGLAPSLRPIARAVISGAARRGGLHAMTK